MAKHDSDEALTILSNLAISPPDKQAISNIVNQAKNQSA